MRHTLFVGGILAAALTLAACGATGSAAAGGDAASGTPDGTEERCMPGAPDCDDTPGQDEAPADDEAGGDMYDSTTASMHAEALLGLSEAELDLNNRVDVRIGRRGEEQMALTEDYLLGRMTVELDSNDTDEWVVTAVTVELPDGPKTFTQPLG